MRIKQSSRLNDMSLGIVKKIHSVFGALALSTKVLELLHHFAKDSLRDVLTTQ